MLLAPDGDLNRWLFALAGAILIASMAWRVRTLSIDGMIAATILGTVVVGTAGWWAGAILIVFFLSSSVLSRVGRDNTIASMARGSRRDATQVFANGGIALISAVGWALTGHPAWLLALAGSLAAANADTWSTEIGRTSPSLPRLITSGKPVVAGTSGAVTARGLGGACAGAFLIGVFTAVGTEQSWVSIEDSATMVALVVTIAGIVGSLVDSVLGATVQEQRWCDACDEQTERRIHRCGATTQSMSCHSWVTNDVVNALCITSGACIAAAAGLF